MTAALWQSAQVKLRRLLLSLSWFASLCVQANTTWVTTENDDFGTFLGDRLVASFNNRFEATFLPSPRSGECPAETSSCGL